MFAKIASLAFAKEIFNVDEIVLKSDIYPKITNALKNKTTNNKVVLLKNIFQRLSLVSDMDFMLSFNIQKNLFLDTLQKLLSKYLKTTQ